MLIVFRSKAAGEVLMLSEHVAPIFALIHKEMTPSGVFTAAQLPATIGALEHAFAAPAPQASPNDSSDEPHANDQPIQVGLRQRAFPLLDLLKKSLAKNADVTWNV